MKTTTCGDQPYYSKGLCKSHYEHQYYLERHPAAYQTISDRFWRFVRKTDSCWLWTGGIVNKGYGQFRAGKNQSRSAHRFAYELLVGPIGDGMQLDHTCRVKCCVNPTHLEPVTNEENMRRAVKARLLLNVKKIG